MTTDSIYLDHAATTPLRPEARAAMEHGFAIWANPSSPHKAGRAARAALEDARARVKAALNWDGEVIFTSGASEALALAISHSKLPLSAVSGVEHEAVLRHAVEVRRWPVAETTGLLGSAWSGPQGLVAVQHVNNETGVIQQLDKVAELMRNEKGVLLADCAQSAGKISLPDADLVAISAHKFGGPIGIGALLVRNFNLLHPTGGQERGYRSGTENLPAVLGMAAALEAGSDWMIEARRLRAKLDAAIEQVGGEVVAKQAPRIATITAYRMPGVSSAAQLIRFDAAGFAVSAGSACSSGSLRASHVLEAMWYPHSNEVIRVSLGRETSEVDVDRFIEAWQQVAGKI